MEIQPLLTAGENVRGVVDRFLAIPDEALFTADVFVADWKVRLRSTCFKAIDLYARRLRARNPITHDSAAGLTLNLLETSALEWARTLSYADWHGSAGHFESNMRMSGLQGVDLGGVNHCAIFDPDQQRGVHLVTSVDDLPPWDSGAPFRVLLHMAAINRGWGLVHGATLAVCDEGVLIVGPGKAGKSGTTLAGISVGLKTVGDDYILVCPASPPTAFRAYNLLKQDRNGLSRIDGLAEATGHLETNWQDKLELDPEELFPGCTVERVRLRAILAPKIAYASRTQFFPVDPQYVFQRFWPSLWAQLPVALVSGFRFAAALTRSLPTFSVLLSDNPAEIGDSIRRFIVGLGP